MHTDNRRGESLMLELSSQAWEKFCCYTFPPPTPSWKASPCTLTANSSEPPSHMGCGTLSFKVTLVLSHLRLSRRCLPAAASMGGSAAGHPSDSSITVGNGGEAEPGWITWYQPAPGKAAELNCHSRKQQNQKYSQIQRIPVSVAH